MLPSPSSTTVILSVSFILENTFITFSIGSFVKSIVTSSSSSISSSSSNSSSMSSSSISSSMSSSSISSSMSSSSISSSMSSSSISSSSSNSTSAMSDSSSSESTSSSSSCSLRDSFTNSLISCLITEPSIPFAFSATASSKFFIWMIASSKMFFSSAIFGFLYFYSINMLIL